MRAKGDPGWLTRWFIADLPPRIEVKLGARDELADVRRVTKLLKENSLSFDAVTLDWKNRATVYWKGGARVGSYEWDSLDFLNAIDTLWPKVEL